MQEVWLLDQEDPLEEGMATHSSILAWRIPWTQETGGLQSMGYSPWLQSTLLLCLKSQTQLSDKQFHFLQLHFSGRYVRLLAFICKLWFVCLCQALGWLVSSGFSYSLPLLSSRFSLAFLLPVCASIIHIINLHCLRLTMTLLSLVLTNWNISVIL